MGGTRIGYDFGLYGASTLVCIPPQKRVEREKIKTKKVYKSV